MSKITINWEASQDNGSLSVSFEELGITEDQWNEMSETDRDEILQQYLDELPQQVFIYVDSWDN